MLGPYAQGFRALNAPMQTKNLRQSVLIAATPHAVYETLMDAKRHGMLIDSDARVSRKIGGAFHLWDDGLSGFNLALKKDRLIVQAWRASGWPKDHYSCARFELKKVRGGTRLTFTQTGIPADKFRGIRQGWIDYYWTPFRKMSDKRK